MATKRNVARSRTSEKSPPSSTLRSIKAAAPALLPSETPEGCLQELASNLALPREPGLPTPLESRALRARDDLKTLATAVALWETPCCTDPLPAAIEALKNISTDLIVLEMAMWPEDGGAINSTLAHRSFASLRGRTKAAVRLVERLEEERKWQS